VPGGPCPLRHARAQVRLQLILLAALEVSQRLAERLQIRLQAGVERVDSRGLGGNGGFLRGEREEVG